MGCLTSPVNRRLTLRHSGSAAAYAASGSADVSVTEGGALAGALVVRTPGGATIKVRANAEGPARRLVRALGTG